MSKKHIPWPPPGSNEAVDEGCQCPVLDNAHGKGTADGNYWVSTNCPIHGAAAKEKTK